MSTRLSKGIYWDRSWNPFTGCTPVGPACDNCWAKRQANRFGGRFGYPADDPFRPTFHPERLSQVNSKQKPQVIATCFMSDPFHGEHLTGNVGQTIDKIIECPQHIFIALTKRPDIMRAFLARGEYPIPNLIGGVSVWDQPSADRMISILLQTNLATRIVSLEPLLAPIDFSLFLHCGISWCIIGGESGPGARAMDENWVRRIVSQCNQYKIPVFYKQKMENGKKVPLPLLDGKRYAEFPPIIDRQSAS